MMHTETATQQFLARHIDHTLLKPEATPGQIQRLCEEALQYQFAAVCVNPCYVGLAARILKGSNIQVATVIGFPLGATLTEAKVYEAHLAIDHGARELDMVLNIGFLKAGEHSKVESEIRKIVELAHERNAIVKVIIEIGLLSEPEIVAAAQAVTRAGADFIKTSTGFLSRGVQLEDIHLLRRLVGNNVQIKASGGIRDAQFALQLLKAGATRLGTSSGVQLMQQLQSS